jgi:hypothetical protein
MNKSEIITATQNIIHAFSETCYDIDEAVYYEKPSGKWSVAENIRHLTLSAKTTTLAYLLPVILVRWIGGRPNRPSRSLEEVEAKYKSKLDEGAKASTRYIPKPVPAGYGKEKLLGDWNKVMSKYLFALSTYRTEKELDNYLVKHPLLGRITLRELCYFTIFHTRHHMETVNSIKRQVSA